MHLQGNYLCVTSEVVIDGKDFPIAPEGDGADENVDCGCSNATRPAQIVDVRSLFVIADLQRCFIEGTQMVSEFSKDFFVADTRKQFLTDWTDELGATILNEFAQGCGVVLFDPIQVRGTSP